jgi:hypothetical protein
VDEATKTSINQKIASVRELKDKDDKAAIEKATQELSTEMQKIGEIMQKAAQAEASQEPKKEEEAVRDAEVTNEEPKKEGE